EGRVGHEPERLAALLSEVLFLTDGQLRLLVGPGLEIGDQRAARRAEAGEGRQLPPRRLLARRVARGAARDQQRREHAGRASSHFLHSSPTPRVAPTFGCRAATTASQSAPTRK